MVIIGAAVCPGAPFLIAGVADSIAVRMRQVADACGDALGRLPAADSVMLISTRRPAGNGRAGASFRRFAADAVTIAMSSVRRSDLAIGAISLPSPDCPAEPTLPIADPAVGTMVGAALLDSISCRLPVTIVEVSGDPLAAANALSGAAASPHRVALLVIADGAACHGDDAPGRRDDRAAGFDDALAVALADGSPARLAEACADRQLAGELLAAVDPLAVLGRLTAARPPLLSEMLYRGAPLGVGYLVACWRWTDG